MSWRYSGAPSGSGRGRVVGQEAFLEEMFVLSAADQGEISLVRKMGKDYWSRKLTILLLPVLVAEAITGK